MHSMPYVLTASASAVGDVTGMLAVVVAAVVLVDLDELPAHLLLTLVMGTVASVGSVKVSFVVDGSLAIYVLPI